MSSRVRVLAREIRLRRPQGNMTNARLPHDIGTRPDFFQYFASSVFTVGELRGNVDMPTGKGFLERLDPLTDPCFTRIDLLTSTYQTNNHCPIRMTIEAGDQKL